MKTKEEVEEYLAKIRRTIDQSNALIEAANLRIAETDRLLAKQGLTREEIGKMRFTTEQRELVNEELRRRGLEPIADWDEESEAVHEQLAAQSGVVMRDEPEGDVDGRRRKFGVFMQGIRL